MNTSITLRANGLAAIVIACIVGTVTVAIFGSGAIAERVVNYLLLASTFFGGGLIFLLGRYSIHKPDETSACECGEEHGD